MTLEITSLNARPTATGPREVLPLTSRKILLRTSLLRAHRPTYTKERGNNPSRLRWTHINHPQKVAMTKRQKKRMHYHSYNTAPKSSPGHRKEQFPGHYRRTFKARIRRNRAHVRKMTTITRKNARDTTPPVTREASTYPYIMYLVNGPPLTTRIDTAQKESSNQLYTLTDALS